MTVGNPLRVLHLTEDLGLGGLERVVTTLCLGIDRARFSPAVLCLRDGGALAGDLEEAGVPVLQLPRASGRTDYLAFLKVARLLRERRIDVLHTHNTPALLDGGVAAILARTPTVVHTEHGRQFPGNWRYTVCEHLLSRTVHRFVGVSERTTESLRRHVRISPHRLRTIPNGVDDTWEASQAAARGRVRDALGITTDQPVIGTIARLSPVKDLSSLLKAAALVRRDFATLAVLIVGVGELERELQREAESLGLGDCVRFLGARRDIPSILAALDVFVLSSLSEGLPMTLLEAMAAGTAIVATRVGGIPEAIRDGIDGSLVDPADSRMLASALSDVLGSEARRRAYGASAREQFLSRFHARAMIDAYQRLYLRQT